MQRLARPFSAVGAASAVFVYRQVVNCDQTSSVAASDCFGRPRRQGINAPAFLVGVPRVPSPIANETRTAFIALWRESASWAEEVRSQFDDFEVRIQTSPSRIATTKSKWYAVTITLGPRRSQEVTAEALMRYIMIENRMVWDPVITGQDVLFAGPGENADILHYRTAAFAGGLISAREFVDARMSWFDKEDGACSIASLDWHEQANLPLTKGTTRACNTFGSGARAWRDEDGKIHLFMISQTAMGGWLPVALLNSTATSAYLDIGKKLMAAFDAGKINPNLSE